MSKQDPVDPGEAEVGVRSWSVVHLTLTVLLITWSGVSNSGLVFETGVGAISDQTRNAFTPASWAFAIWGPIYLALLAMTLFGLRRAFGLGRSSDFVAQLGWPFALAQIACSLWLAVWLLEAVFASLVVMTILLGSLYLCIRRLDMERWEAPWAIIALVWWPMSLYFGWITAAWVANLSSTLVDMGLDLPQTSAWAIGAALGLTGVHLALIARRNMRESALVAVWALVAVGARHWDAPLASPVFLATTACVVVLLIAVTAHGLRNFTWPPREAREG